MIDGKASKASRTEMELMADSSTTALGDSESMEEIIVQCIVSPTPGRRMMQVNSTTHRLTSTTQRVTIIIMPTIYLKPTCPL